MPAGRVLAALSLAWLLSSPLFAAAPRASVSLPPASRSAPPAALAASALAAPSALAAAAAPSAAAAVAPAAAPALETQAPAESAKALSDERFENPLQLPAEASAPASAAELASGPLAPASAPGSAQSARVPEPARASASPQRERVRDRLRYWTLLARSYLWYNVVHMQDLWPRYRSQWEAARAKDGASVSEPRAFFVAMRTTGMSGRFYPLGGAALQDERVVDAFRGAFARWFDAPGIAPEARAAFEAYMARAKSFNAAHRAHSNLYKNIRDPLIRASLLPPAELAGYFDALLPHSRRQAVAVFQRAQMEAVRGAFIDALRKTLAEEDPGDPARVRAALLLGSFATGSAGPGSDLDVELLADNADSSRVPAFIRRLQRRWTAKGYHGRFPAIVHEHAYWPSRGMVWRIHTGAFIPVAAEPALEARLTRAPGEKPLVELVRADTARGRVNLAFQRLLITGVTRWADLRAWARSRLRPSEPPLSAADSLLARGSAEVSLGARRYRLILRKARDRFGREMLLIDALDPAALSRGSLGHVDVSIAGASARLAQPHMDGSPEPPAGVPGSAELSRWREHHWFGLSVVPERRGAGLGRELVVRAAELLRRAGVRRLFVEATPSSRDFYLKALPGRLIREDLESFREGDALHRLEFEL